MVSRCVLLAGIAAATAAGADFSLTIASPIAASGPAPQDSKIKMKVSKGALFAIRMEECPALNKAELTGVAEGIADGAYVSVPVIISSTGTPGVYVAIQTWNPGPGMWVVGLSASCGNAKAGALVSIGPQGFQRESTKLLPRPATKADIDAELKLLQSAN
ncbi:MAG: hypothetical protein JO062_00260 [Bryobacterales bacterium]|nr:hypothetical protein [Bryobacterales bacterium]